MSDFFSNRFDFIPTVTARGEVEFRSVTDEPFNAQQQSVARHVVTGTGIDTLLLVMNHRGNHMISGGPFVAAVGMYGASFNRSA